MNVRRVRPRLHFTVHLDRRGLECPQLFELDGHWVLLVSVWSDRELHYVAYALGSYDGVRFGRK